MQSGLLTLRKPMPVARSIHWVPAAAPADETVRASEVPLFVTQGALREAMRHLRSDPEQELMGFLLGNLFEDSNTGSRYVVITSALRTGHVITEEDPVLIPQEEWLGMQLELRRRRAGLMGWYHSAPFVGPHPVRLDLETHRERFQEPWQTGLVIATAGAEPTGGFFRMGLSGDRLLNGAFVPFDELADDESLLPGGRKRTFIDWANYRTEQDVETDRTERRPHLPPRPPRMPTPPRGQGAGGPGTPGQTDVPDAVPTLPVMLPEPSVFDDDTPAMPPPERSRTRIALFAMMVLGAAAAAGGLWWWNQRIGPDQPPGFSTGVYRPATPVRRQTAAAPAAGTDTSALASRPAGDSSALGAGPDTVGLAGGGGAMSATAPVTPAPTPSVPSDGIPQPAPSSDPHIARFDSMADSLEEAIRNFGDRNSDFSMKRLGCGGLAVGYRAADDAYIGLAAAYRDARDAIDNARDARFRQLSSRMGAVNTSFDATKCPRP